MAKDCRKCIGCNNNPVQAFPHIVPIGVRYSRGKSEPYCPYFLVSYEFTSERGRTIIDRIKSRQSYGYISSNQ
jgi:hypothetical protein